jgi:3-phenylpropionate/trans-cinnamate dioxygenase ferredoxin subunit
MSTVVGRLSDFPDRAPQMRTVEGEDVLVVCIDGEIFAVDDLCTHADVSLSEGEVVDCTIECWLHGSAFSLRTGQPLSPPATRPLAVHTVVTDDQSDPQVSITLGRS